jgi:hypothetical protein
MKNTCSTKTSQNLLCLSATVFDFPSKEVEVYKHTRFLFVATLVLVCAIPLVAQEPCNRHTQSDGGFSICIPDGWTARERPNSKYQFLFGPAADNFAPNINVRDELSTLNLSDYVAAGIRTTLARKDELGATSIEALGQSEFVTTAGLRGIRSTFLTLYKGFWVRSIQYYFDAGNNRKLILTGTELEKDKEVLDSVFDRAAKSFRLN